MNDTRTYQIEVQDQVDENDLNAASPIHIQVTPADLSATLLTVCTDQSGLIGLIRHLHARGLVLLSINSVQPDPDTHPHGPGTTNEQAVSY